MSNAKEIAELEQENKDKDNEINILTESAAKLIGKVHALEQRNEKLEVMVKELEKYLLDRNWEVYKLRAKMRSMEQVAKFRIENLTVLGD